VTWFKRYTLEGELHLEYGDGRGRKGDDRRRPQLDAARVPRDGWGRGGSTPQTSLVSHHSTLLKNKIKIKIKKEGRSSHACLIPSIYGIPSADGWRLLAFTLMPPVPTSVDGMERKTLVQKEQDVLTRLPLPPHWRRPAVNGPLGALQRTIFNILSIASFGHVGLSPVWASIRLYHEGDDSVWVEGTRQLCDRLNNFLLVVGI
jgi:hypothetical protein